MKNYLPSKKFTYTILGFVGLGILIFLISNTFFGKNRFLSSNKQKNLETQKLTVNQLIQKDSDQDGVADWEEALWGTDPNKKITFDNLPDGTYIDNKKKLLNLEDKANTENMTETDKFAREFFTAFTAMKASGQVDPSMINNFSNALGQKIIDPALIDTYAIKDEKIKKQDDIESRQKYYEDLSILFEKYQSLGIGDELLILGNNLSTSTIDDPEKMSNDLLVISQAYKDFAQKVIETPVPESLSQYGLKIANGANNTGISVFNMSRMASDPVIGISGLSQYQKYSEDLISVVKELETELGIQRDLVL